MEFGVTISAPRQPTIDSCRFFIPCILAVPSPCNLQSAPSVTMLSRAATRAFHGLRTAPAVPVRRITPVASTSQRIRFYAHKPGKNNAFKPAKATGDPVLPSEQPEFDAAAAPERNTTPSGQQGEPLEETPQQPQKPLPDLRYGIPSTFGKEFGGEEAKPQKGEHDPNNITEEPEKEPGPGREGGELPKSAYETSTDRRRNKVANWSYIAFALAATTGGAYLCRNWESEEEEKKHADAPSGWTPTLMYQRAKARLNGEMSYYTEPTFNKLLPEVEMMPPLTLVLSLEDLLVHSEWTTKHGWRTAKRPGVDYFLRYLSQYYELVIFTSAKSMDADPIIRKLDPYRIVMWPLFREATRYEKGEYIKVCLIHEQKLDLANVCRTSHILTATSRGLSSSIPTHRTSKLSPRTPSCFQSGRDNLATRAS